MAISQEGRAVDCAALVRRCEQVPRGEEVEDPGGVDDRELDYCCRLAGQVLARRSVFAPLDPERHVRPALRAILGDPAFPDVVRYCSSAVRRSYRSLGGAITAGLPMEPDDPQDLAAWVRPVTALNLLLAAALPRGGRPASSAYAAVGVRRLMDRDVRTARRREELLRLKTITGESRLEPADGATARSDELAELERLWALRVERGQKAAADASHAPEELAEEFAAALVSVARAALAGALRPRRVLPAVLKCMALVLRQADPALGSIAAVTENVIDRLRMLPGDASWLRRLVTAEGRPVELVHLSRRPMWSNFLRLLHDALCERLGLIDSTRPEESERNTTP